METDRDLAHTAYRRLFCYEMRLPRDPGPFPSWNNFGWLDLDVVGDSSVDGDSDTNSFGWVLHQEIKSFATLPVAGTPGVEMRLLLSHAASGHFIDRTWEFEEIGNQWFWDRDGNPTGSTAVSEVKSVDFPYDHVKSFEWAMSDCFLFPRALPAPLDFAAFNGTDTSILFDQFTNDTDARYQLEFDARFRDFSTNALLARTDNTVSWVNINRGAVEWKQFAISFSPSLVNNVWYRIRLEYNWNDPGTGRKLYLDGLLNAHLPSSGNVDLHFNLMGKKGPTYIGDFDCKNLTLLDTDPASPRVVLDMPLLVNACDVGELSIKGTTENMSLPSCP